MAEIFGPPIDDETGWWPWGRPDQFCLRVNIDPATEPYVHGWYDIARKVWIEELVYPDGRVDRYENKKRVERASDRCQMCG